jgi:hypothetical protein
MPPRSFSVYQPVHSHAFADFGLSGGLEALRCAKASSTHEAKSAGTIVDRCIQPSGFCSVKQIRASTFPDQNFTSHSQSNARNFLASANKGPRHRYAEADANHDDDFTFASISRRELARMGEEANQEFANELRSSSNNSSSLALLEASGTRHLLWTTGSNGQFLMCAPMDIARVLSDPTSTLNSSRPAFDSSSIPTALCFTHQRIADIEVTDIAHSN